MGKGWEGMAEEGRGLPGGRVPARTGAVPAGGRLAVAEGGREGRQLVGAGEQQQQQQGGQQQPAAAVAQRPAAALPASSGGLPGHHGSPPRSTLWRRRQRGAPGHPAPSTPLGDGDSGGDSGDKRLSERLPAPGRAAEPGGAARGGQRLP